MAQDDHDDGLDFARSAMDRNGGEVSNIKYFYDAVGQVLGFLLDRHPIPSTLPMLPIVGDTFREEDRLHEIYYRTLDFLEDEKLIRTATPRARSADRHVENLPDPDLYRLTLRSMSILTLKPKGLFLTESGECTAGEVLIKLRKEALADAESKDRKQLVAWLIAQVPRVSVGCD